MMFVLEFYFIFKKKCVPIIIGIKLYFVIVNIDTQIYFYLKNRIGTKTE